MYNFICVLFYFAFRRKTRSKPRKSVVFSTSGWHLTTCLNYVWKVMTVWVIPAVGLFFLFLFLFFNSESLHPLPAVNSSLWGGRKRCIAVCKLFYYFFIIIIKGLTFSSHHCEITDLFEWYVTLKRLVCCFCAVSVLGWGWAGGLGIGNGGAAEVLWMFQSLYFLPEACREWKHLLYCTFLACPSLLSLSCNWSFIWI